MSQNPFVNDYLCRLVAETDSRACSLCYKPTSMVFVSSDNLDFFYICPGHTRDTNFSSPIHSDAYKKLIAERKLLEIKVERANEKAESCKPYSWNRFASKIGWTETPKEDAKDKLKPDEKSYEALLNESNDLKKELAETVSAIEAYKFKKFVLNKDIYLMRINKYVQNKTTARKQQERQQELQDPSFFPLAPTGALGKK